LKRGQKKEPQKVPGKSEGNLKVRRKTWEPGITLSWDAKRGTKTTVLKTLEPRIPPGKSPTVKGGYEPVSGARDSQSRYVEDPSGTTYAC